ncbi:MAG: DUF4892 domain-containing protein [Sulfurovum sp.]
MKKMLIGAAVSFMTLLMADASIPASDLKGSKDLAYLKRYEGSMIIAYQHKRFDRFVLPLAALKADKGKRDGKNNIYFAPETSKVLEGEHTRLVYLLPPERTPLEVLKNNEEEILSRGGKTLFECEKSECGGDAHRTTSGGGGEMSLSMFLQSEEDVKGYNEVFSNGYCALTSRITDQHYLTAELPSDKVFLSVLTYQVTDSSFCKAFKDRTIAVVDAVEIKEREQKMVVIKAEEMDQKIRDEGMIALYGIYFDTDKAVIKAESKPTLDEIAKMLEQNPQQKILVVGHTDNEGSFEYNKGLSQRRAEAVVDRLAGEYKISPKRLHPTGVSYACPVASNSSEEGKAKNRRVVLVGQ